MSTELLDVMKELKEIRSLLSKPELRVLSYEDVGELLGVSASTVRRMEKQPHFPRARKYPTDNDGRPVTRFVAKEIHAWIERKPN